jgi:hypothetical protein
MGRAKVDTDRNASLMRIGCFTRLGNLQQCHMSLSQRFQAVIDVLGKALNEHEGSNLLGRRRHIVTLVQRAPKLREGHPLPFGDFIGQRLDFVDRSRFFERLSPLHLLHQEGGRHGGVVVWIDRHAGQFAQVRRPLERVSQALVSLVHTNRPLHGHTLSGLALRSEAVGVHFGLKRAPTPVQRTTVELKAPWEAEEFEVVAVERHGVKKRRGSSRA